MSARRNKICRSVILILCMKKFMRMLVVTATPVAKKNYIPKNIFNICSNLQHVCFNARTNVSDHILCECCDICQTNVATCVLQHTSPHMCSTYLSATLLCAFNVRCSEVSICVQRMFLRCFHVFETCFFVSMCAANVSLVFFAALAYAFDICLFDVSKRVSLRGHM